jgi:predicted HicB family RNase H-like nuclease
MPEGTAKGGMFSFRVSEQDAEVIRAAAQKAGLPVTQWVRQAVLLSAGVDATV